MTNLNREPKGKSTGGQFAPDVNPESTIALPPELSAAEQLTFEPGDWVLTSEGKLDSINVVYQPESEDDEICYRLAHFNDRVYLASQLRRPDEVDEVFDLTQPVKTPTEAIAWCEGELAQTVKKYDEMVEAGKSDDPDALDMRDYMDELRDQLVDHQRDLIAELRTNRPARLLGLARCAYAVDEAVDSLTRWDGGGGSNPADMLRNLIEVRDEVFLAASPELVEQWRNKEAKIREFERDCELSPLDDDEYEVMRDEREALFQQIYEEALAS